MKRRLAAAAVLAVAAGAPAPMAASRGPERVVASHCRAGESVVYSCRFGRRIGSVCAGEGRVHYRFGAPGRPEIALTSLPDFANVRIGMVTGQQGGRQRHVRFTSADTHYVVFEGVDGQLADRPGRTYSGIAVLSGERQIATLACRGRPAIAADFLDRITDQAPPARRDALEETPGGPFDAWF